MLFPSSIKGEKSPALRCERLPDIEPVSPALEHPDICFGRDLTARLEAYRRARLRIVFTNGCFDILHPGHVDLLDRARRLGDVLVLGLNTDASVRSLGKGEDRPVNPLAVRAFMAAHLRSVDCVTCFDEPTPAELIRLVHPDVLVKGGDWTPDRIVGADYVLSYGGRVFSLPMVEGYSTTSFISRLRK